MKYTNVSVKNIIAFSERNSKKIFIVGISILVSQGLSFIPYINLLFTEEFRWAIILITIFLVFRFRGVSIFRIAIILFLICAALSFTKQIDLREAVGNLIYIVLWYGTVHEIVSLRKDKHLVQ